MKRQDWGHLEGGFSRRLKVQVLLWADEGRTDTTHAGAMREKGRQRTARLRLTLATAQPLFPQLQRRLCHNFLERAQEGSTVCYL
jgi:hypothetical protein